MTAIEEAVLKARQLVKRAIDKGFVDAKYYEFALPWIFIEYLGYLRSELENNLIHSVLYHRLRYFFYRKYLQFVHFSNTYKIGKYDIVFFGSYFGHYEIYKELESQLKENALSYIYVTDKIALYNKIKSQGDKVIFLNINLTTKLANYLRSNISNQINFDSLIEETIEVNVNHFKHLENSLNSLLFRISPKLIITANELLTEHRALILAGKKLDIKSMTLQHGLISNGSINYKELIADMILVYGNITKKILIDMGIAKEKIEVVGSLLIKNKKAIMYENLKEESKINVLVATSGFGNSTSYQNHISIIEAINYVAAKLPKINFNIKLHRKDNIQFYKNITAKNISIISENNLLIMNKTFIDLVNENDAMLTSTSTSMFDAFLLKKPVLGIDFYAEFKENEFYKEGLLIVSENVVDLENNLKNLKEKPEIFEPIINKANKYLEEYYNLGCSNDTPQKKTVNQIINSIKE